MAYDKFEILKSTGVPLNIDNVDTDQIIPARFLKQLKEKVLAIIYLEIGDIILMAPLLIHSH